MNRVVTIVAQAVRAVEDGRRLRRVLVLRPVPVLGRARSKNAKVSVSREAIQYVDARVCSHQDLLLTNRLVARVVALLSQGRLIDMYEPTVPRHEITGIVDRQGLVDVDSHEVVKLKMTLAFSFGT